MPTFKAIAAMSENRAIGQSGDIPWHLPEDFKWFKTKTMGGILVMGRKTFESIGRPLPGRVTYVFSRSKRSIEGVENFTDTRVLDELETDKTVWIAGGGDIYRQLLPKCAELYLTRVHRTVEGDAFFPEFESAFKLAEVLYSNDDFTIERWVRSEAAPSA